VVETPAEIARRIEAAEKILGQGRVRFVHPDCGFWMPKRSVADRKMEALVKGSPLFLSDLLMGHEPHFEFLLVINGLRTQFMERNEYLGLH
jgi:hypothetical protein